MFDIQGTVLEKAEMQDLLNVLQKTKTGKRVLSGVDVSPDNDSLILKFDENLPARGYSERGQVRLNPKLLSTQNERVSTLAHELTHTKMRDIFVTMVQNASSLDEYALARLLWEGHAWMMGDSILQELNPSSRKKEGFWYETVDLTTKEGRTLYLEKVLALKTGWAEYELQQNVDKSRKFPDKPNADIFKANCAKFLEEMDVDVTLADVLKTKPYSHFIQRSSNLWEKCKKFFGR